ncbi:MAG: hypothetical protein V6Z86_04180 [Hyphomicrobiales bacterium]
MTQEPPAGDNPIFKIADRPDVILTSHVAWASIEVLQIL